MLIDSFHCVGKLPIMLVCKLSGITESSRPQDNLFTACVSVHETLYNGPQYTGCPEMNRTGFITP